jgi:hypothetical protein
VEWSWTHSPAFCGRLTRTTTACARKYSIERGLRTCAHNRAFTHRYKVETPGCSTYSFTTIGRTTLSESAYRSIRCYCPSSVFI